jgi:hypothetical protein
MPDITDKETSVTLQKISEKIPGPNPPPLCDFCRPRLDLAKLGWKRKTEVDGEAFLEPECAISK